MAAPNTFNTLSPGAQSTEIGVIFPKATMITVADFDKDLGEIDPSIFVQDELFGAFMVVNSVIQTYTVTVKLKTGVNKILTVPLWAWIPVQGLEIVAAGTSATLILVLAGQ